MAYEKLMVKRDTYCTCSGLLRLVELMLFRPYKFLYIVDLRPGYTAGLLMASTGAFGSVGSFFSSLSSSSISLRYLFYLYLFYFGAPTLTRPLGTIVSSFELSIFSIWSAMVSLALGESSTSYSSICPVISGIVGMSTLLFSFMWIRFWLVVPSEITLEELLFGAFMLY